MQKWLTSLLVSIIKVLYFSNSCKITRNSNKRPTRSARTIVKTWAG